MGEINEGNQKHGGDAAKGFREWKLIANLLALLAVKEESQDSNIGILNAAGFTPSEIARLIRTTPNTVSVTLNKLKKSTVGRRGSKLKSR